MRDPAYEPRSGDISERHELRVDGTPHRSRHRDLDRQPHEVEPVEAVDEFDGKRLRREPMRDHAQPNQLVRREPLHPGESLDDGRRDLRILEDR